MESSDAIVRKVLDAMHLMEVRLTEKITGRCDIVERRMDARCDELHCRFTARGYTIQQEVDAVIYDESSDHDGYGAAPFDINGSGEKSIFDDGPSFDEEHCTFSADNAHFNDVLRAHLFDSFLPTTTTVKETLRASFMREEDKRPKVPHDHGCSQGGAEAGRPGGAAAPQHRGARVPGGRREGACSGRHFQPRLSVPQVPHQRDRDGHKALLRRPPVRRGRIRPRLLRLHGPHPYRHQGAPARRALAKRIWRNTTTYDYYHQIFVLDREPPNGKSDEPLRVNNLFQHIKGMLSGKRAAVAEKLGLTDSQSASTLIDAQVVFDEMQQSDTSVGIAHDAFNTFFSEIGVNEHVTWIIFIAVSFTASAVWARAARRLDGVVVADNRKLRQASVDGRKMHCYELLTDEALESWRTRSSGQHPRKEYLESPRADLRCMAEPTIASIRNAQAPLFTTMYELEYEREEDVMFSFNTIFYENGQQSDVYNFHVVPIVSDTINGIIGTIITYGQSGASKTYSMDEPSILHHNEQKTGLVQRVVDELFVCLGSSASTWIMKLPMVEIYLQKVRNLLDLSKDNPQIKESKIQGIYISGAIEIFIFNSSDVLENLFPGIDNSAVGKTHMNLASSRNNCLCIFSVQYESTSDERVPSGTIILIDLDGSEKVGTTGAEGRGLDKAKTINIVIDSLSFVSVTIFQLEGIVLGLIASAVRFSDLGAVSSGQGNFSVFVWDPGDRAVMLLASGVVLVLQELPHFRWRAAEA
jgi:hypothetical protein